MPDEVIINQGEGRQVVYLSPYPGLDRGGSQEKAIDLLELWSILWRRKFFISALTLLITLIAVYVCLYVLPVTYQSETVLMQNSSSDSSSSLGSLSSLASSLSIPISLPGGDSGSQILVFLQSRDLQVKLIEKYDLLPRLYKSLWDPVKKVWLVDDPKDLPTAILAIQKEMLKDIYQVAQDEKTQLITITWVDEDAVFSAGMLKRVLTELDYYLAHEYDSDAKRERVFVEKQLAEATGKLEHWEKQVPNGELTLTKIKREQLAANSVYVELRKQVELARFTEEKEVIKYKIIDPPFVPEDKYRPKRGLICALVLVMGGFVAISIVFVQYGLGQRKKKRTTPQGDSQQGL